MAIRVFIVLLVAAGLSACASIDGLYVPACMAYEGDEIELADGKFTWRRFTDQRTLDEDGEVVDPFPDYPMNGTAELQDSALVLTPDNGRPATRFHTVRDGQELYLLTVEQNQRYVADASLPECALHRSR